MSVQHRTHNVRVGDASINVNEWGNGPSLLLLHGNPDSGVMWKDVANRLAERCHCIAPDLPGFGHSEVPAGYEPTLDGMAGFVEQLLRACGIARPIDVVAHDFGGPFAFAWAVKYPDAVRCLVAINTVFFSDYPWHFWARVWRTRILGELAMAVMNRPMFARELRRGSASRLSNEHIERTWALITPRMKRQTLRLYRARNPENFRGWEDDLLRLTAARPTLVIWGDKDPYIPSRFAERFNTKRIVHLPETGHWPPIEAPVECATAILNFFSETA